MRGRFAKNDEFGEHHRNSYNTHEEDTDEDVKSMHVRTKKKTPLLVSIFSHQRLEIIKHERQFPTHSIPWVSAFQKVKRKKDKNCYLMRVQVKEEEKLDSSDIFAHISGLNSFRCNYPIQSWI